MVKEQGYLRLHKEVEWRVYLNWPAEECGVDSEVGLEERLLGSHHILAEQLIADDEVLQLLGSLFRVA